MNCQATAETEPGATSLVSTGASVFETPCGVKRPLIKALRQCLGDGLCREMPGTVNSEPRDNSPPCSQLASPIMTAAENTSSEERRLGSLGNGGGVTNLEQKHFKFWNQLKDYAQKENANIRFRNIFSHWSM